MYDRLLSIKQNKFIRNLIVIVETCCREMQIAFLQPRILFLRKVSYLAFNA